jgi:hypothetical protein
VSGTGTTTDGTYTVQYDPIGDDWYTGSGNVNVWAPRDGSGHWQMNITDLYSGDTTVYTAPATDYMPDLPADGSGWTLVSVNGTPVAPPAGPADGYLIEGSTDGGATWQRLGMSTGASFLATNLCANAGELFRVTPYNAAGYGTPGTTAGTTTVGQQSAAGWYKVSFNDPNNPGATSEPITIGDTAFTTVSGTFTLNNGGWVQADSMRQALSGSVTSYDPNYHVTNTFVYGQTGAFRFNPDLNIDGQDVGPAIVMEDEFNEPGHGDQNYTDVYLPVTVRQPIVQTAASTDPAPFATGEGTITVGHFDSGDGSDDPAADGTRAATGM